MNSEQNLHRNTTSNDVALGMGIGYLLGDSNHDPNANVIYKCVSKDNWLHKTIYFAKVATSDDVYAIETGWVVRHDDKIKDYLIKSSFHVFDNNPSDECNWIINRAYAWSHDTVVYKGNASIALNMAAKGATEQSTAIEWALIFIWLWGPIAIIAIGSFIYYLFKPLWNKIDVCIRIRKSRVPPVAPPVVIYGSTKDTPYQQV